MLGECKSFDDVKSDKQLWMCHCGRTLCSSSLLELTTHEVSHLCSRVGWWGASLPRMWQSIYTILGCKKPCRCRHGQVCCVCTETPQRLLHSSLQTTSGGQVMVLNADHDWMRMSQCTDTLPSFSRSCECIQVRISSFGSWLRIC